MNIPSYAYLYGPTKVGRLPVETIANPGNHSGNQLLATSTFLNRQAAQVRAMVVAHRTCEPPVRTCPARKSEYVPAALPGRTRMTD